MHAVFIFSAFLFYLVVFCPCVAVVRWWFTLLPSCLFFPLPASPTRRLFGPFSLLALRRWPSPPYSLGTVPFPRRVVARDCCLPHCLLPRVAPLLSCPNCCGLCLLSLLYSPVPYSFYFADGTSPFSPPIPETDERSLRNPPILKSRRNEHRPNLRLAGASAMSFFVLCVILCMGFWLCPCFECSIYN